MIDWEGLAFYLATLACGYGFGWLHARHRFGLTRKIVEYERDLAENQIGIRAMVDEVIEADEAVRLGRQMGKTVRGQHEVARAIGVDLDEMRWDGTPSTFALGPPTEGEMIPMLSFELPFPSREALAALDPPAILDRLRYGRHAGAVVTGINWLRHPGPESSDDSVISDEALEAGGLDLRQPFIVDEGHGTASGYTHRGERVKLRRNDRGGFTVVDDSGSDGT